MGCFQRTLSPWILDRRFNDEIEIAAHDVEQAFPHLVVATPSSEWIGIRLKLHDEVGNFAAKTRRRFIEEHELRHAVMRT